MENKKPKNPERTAIKVEGVHKKFKIYYDKGNTLKERLLFRNRNRHEDRWVLRGVDLEIKQGESVGLVGENGSGKSTLLKILSKILYPNMGSVELNGRVSSLLELGAGFHPDLSGRENIYNNASIFGLSEKEIDKRLPAIIDFSELHQFIDNPVRTYSSGMYMRLAFSVAINVDADILLVDEILAVGDANFQRKCFNMLREIKSKGTTILIVSHSLGQIEQFCDRSIWLENGVIRMDGFPRLVHAEYLEFMDKRVRDEALAAQQQQQEQEAEEEQPEPMLEQAGEEEETGEEDEAPTEPEDEYLSGKQRFGNRDYEITAVRLLDKNKKACSVFETGQALNIEMDYKRNRKQDGDDADAIIGIGIFRNDGVQCYGTNTFIDFGRAMQLGDKGIITFSAPANILLNAEYWLDVAIESINGFPYDYWRQCIRFQTISSISDAGVCRMEHVWGADGKVLDG